MNLNETEMRDTAARICRDYLTGAWRTVKPQDLLFKRISGGLSNFLYHVALPESAVVEHSEPSSAPSSGSVTTNHQNGYHQNGDHIDTSFASKYSNNFLRRSSDDELLKTFNDESGYCLKEEYNLDTLSDSSDSEECGFQGEPRQVLLRIYGQIHGDQAVEAIITESVIFTLLSERRLGPKLHGVFPGGRIEQYIPARPLRTKEMSDPVLCVKIAEKMSAIHSMHVPLSKEPDWLWKTMNKWITTAENNLERHQMKDDHESSTVDHIRQMKLRSEIEWLKQFVQGCGSPVVFSHNDMQEGNILLRQTRHHTNNLEDTGIHGKGVQVADVVVVENSCDGVDSRSYVEPPLTEDDGIACDFSQQMALKDNTDLFESSHPQTKNLHLLQNQNSNHLTSLEDCLTSSTSSSSSSDSVLSRSSKKSSLNNNEPELVLIDFEYCSYNYRGFDLANHFIEWTYDYSNADYPYFYDRPEDYPTEEQQERFITAYLQSSQRYRNGHLSPTSSSRSSREGFSISQDDYCTSSTRASSRRSSNELLDGTTRSSRSRSGSVVVTSKQIAEIMDEIRVFTLASHLFWGMWACVNASLSQIPFGYWDYASSRLDRYFELKKDICNNMPLTTKSSATLKRKITDLE